MTSLNLGAVHNATRASIKAVSTMHRGSVVPQDKIAKSPLMAIDIVLLHRVSPQGVKKCLTVLQWLAQNVGVTAAT
jgi:hypothetical protein